MQLHAHWVRNLRASLPLFFAVLLHACGGSHETPVAHELIETEFVANPLSAVDPTAVPAADNADTVFYVFTNQSEWATWWARVRSSYRLQPLPQIDFSTHTVAGIYLGMRSNSCYVLVINEVVQRDEAILVRYHEARPDAGETCSPVAVYPLALIKIQAIGLPIQFVEE